MVDQLDGRSHGATQGVQIRRPHERRRHGRRRPHGALALAAVGEPLGVALVQAGHGVAQAVAGKDLDEHARLGDDELLALEGGDVEASTGGAARGDVAAEERQGLAQRRQRLVSNDGILAAQQAAEGFECLLTPVGGFRRVIDDADTG